MIGFLRGMIVAKKEQSIILDVHDVGYIVALPTSTLHRIQCDDRCSFFVYHNVREDISDLYGFETHEELDFFERLLSVSGVGPKTALSIVGVASLERLSHAIACGDASLLKMVSGVGTKTAERIVVELKNSFATKALGQAGVSSADEDIIDALVGLGYTSQSARDAVRGLAENLTTPETRLREALRLMGSRV